MSKSAGIENVALDDADPEKRNKALIIENDSLKDQMLEQELSLIELAKRVNVMRGVQEIGYLNPDEVRKLYAAVEAAIEAFVGPMYRLIREDAQYKDRIMKAINRKNSFTYFRAAIRADSGLRAAATDPLTSITDIWTAYIWRILEALVFKKDAINTFYSSEGAGQNASDYMRHLGEIENLMALADPPVFGRYARRVWKRQALAAMFRTAKFEWIENARAASIASVSDQLRKMFRPFTSPMPEGRPLQLIRNIVVAAVELNEHMMIEADDIWTLRLYGAIAEGDDFYEKMENYNLTPVGNTVGLRDNSPLDTIKQRLSLDVIKTRVKPLCVVAPALQFEHIEPDGNAYKDVENLVAPRVLVALTELPPAQGEEEPGPAPPDEVVFATLARNMALSQ